jgi:hypothetical protein
MTRDKRRPLRKVQTSTRKRVVRDTRPDGHFYAGIGVCFFIA